MKLFLVIASLAVPLSIGAQIRQPDIIGTMRQGEEIRLLREQTRMLELENQKRESELQTDDDRVRARFQEAIKYRRFRWDDFDTVAFSNDDVTIDMIGLMAESKLAADIAYYLGQNRRESKKISRMPIEEAAKAIFAIEALLSESK
jgi:hypothetical protein